MLGTWLGLASFALAAANSAWFLGRMQRVAVPQNRIAHELAWAGAIALGIAALVEGGGWLGAVLALLGILPSAAMLLLRLGSAQAKATPTVVVGGPILAFRAPDEDGAPFDSSSLAGQPYLLKFFRGHW
jgi:hypothetical protein